MDLHDLTDRQLLQSSRDSVSPEVLAEILRRYGPMVRASADRRVRDPHTADDIAQAVFILFFQRLRRMNDRTILSTWFYRATRMTTANALRVRARRLRYEQSAARERKESSESVAQFSQELLPLLDPAMDALRSGDRTVLLLRFFRRQSLAEVGSELGISSPAAARRIERALDRLRRQFERLGAAVPLIAMAPALEQFAAPALPNHFASEMAARVLSGSGRAESNAFSLARGTLHMIRRKYMVSVVVAVGAAASVPAAIVCAWPSNSPVPQAADTRAAAADPPTAETATRAKLDRVAAEVQFDDLTFSDALQFLTDLSGIKFAPDWPALERAGVTRTKRIRLRLPRQSVRADLEATLDKAAGKHGLLTYKVDGSGVAISVTKEEKP